MGIRLICSCGNTLEAGEESIGATTTCPKCSRVVNVPRYRYEVFVSYSSLDRPQAEAVCEVLERRRLRCFMAHRDILPGSEWGAKIVEAIYDSRLVVLIFSASSNASTQVMRELERAVSRRIPILPLRIEDVPVSQSIEYYISAAQWLDALTAPLEQHLERLAEATELLLNGQVVETPLRRGEPVNASPGKVGSHAAGSLGAGVAKVYGVARSLLGPRGRSIALRGGDGMPLVTRSTSVVLDLYRLKDSGEDLALQLIRKQASLVRRVAGYGAGLTTVLTGELFLRASESARNGTSAAALRKGMELATDAIVAELRRVSRSVNEQKDIADIATSCADGDAEIGALIAAALDRVGQDGLIAVGETKGLDTTLDVVNGIQFDRGYLSAQFVTDQEKNRADLEGGLILIHDQKISSWKPLLPVLEMVARLGKPLLIIAHDLEGDVLPMLVANQVRKTLSVCAVKAPGFGDRRTAMLQDIAILTAGTVLSEGELEKVTLEDLGSAKRMVIDKETTTIIDSAGDRNAIAARVKEIHVAIGETISDYDREKLQERLAKLVGGVAVIEVGALTEAEVTERKTRVENAYQAVRSAIEEGIVPGGGIAYVRALPLLRALAVDEGEAQGAGIVAASLEGVLRAMVENAGLDPEPILAKVRASHGDFGFDVAGEQFGLMNEMGIVDSVRALRFALQTANGLASLLLDQTVRGAALADFVASVPMARDEGAA